MTDTFAVGDKVTHNMTGMHGVVTYGPFNRRAGVPAYVVQRPDGTEAVWLAVRVTAAKHAFAIGDRAKIVSQTEPVEIIGGPFKNRFHTWFAVHGNEVGDTTASENELTALPTPDPISVGDWVRVTADDPHNRTGEFVGKMGVVIRLGHMSSQVPYRVSFDAEQDAPHDEWNVASVEKTTGEYRYGGITYNLSAKYRDAYGDVWTLGRVGNIVAGATLPVGSPRSESPSLGHIVRKWGPLTRV